MIGPFTCRLYLQYIELMYEHKVHIIESIPKPLHYKLRVKSGCALLLALVSVLVLFPSFLQAR